MKLFNYNQPPQTNRLINENYLGNGYFKKPDKSENKLEAVNSFQVGGGNRAVKMNMEEGLWIGGDKSEEARASFDLEGNYIYRDENKVPSILIGEIELTT